MTILKINNFKRPKYNNLCNFSDWNSDSSKLKLGIVV